jgi:uncharacterized protein
MRPTHLQTRSRKELESLARQQGVPGAGQLRKDDLIAALALPRATTSKRTPSTAVSSAVPRATRQRPEVNLVPARVPHDVLHVEVQDGDWLRVAWQVSSTARERAIAALGKDWHTAKPVLQLIDATPEEGHEQPAEKLIEVELQAGSPVWYIRVPNPERAYRLSLGYRTTNRRWHLVLQSRPIIPARQRAKAVEVTSTAPSLPQKTPLQTPDHLGGLRLRFAESESGLATGVLSPSVGAPPLDVQLELVLHGRSTPTAAVTLQAKPQDLNARGEFLHALPLAAGRHVIPVVSTGDDGTGERTVVVALDVSIRELEPRVFED